MKFEGFPTESEEIKKEDEPEAEGGAVAAPEAAEPLNPAESDRGETEAPRAEETPSRPPFTEARPQPAAEPTRGEDGPRPESGERAEGAALAPPTIEADERATEVVAEDELRERSSAETAGDEREATPEGKARAERVDAIAQEETRKLLPEKLAKARRGLAQLYDILPHDRRPSQDEIVTLIDNTELEELLPAWRRKLAEKIRWENLARKSKAEFVSGGMELLYEWAYVEAMKDASGAVLERLQREPDAGPRAGRSAEAA